MKPADQLQLWLNGDPVHNKERDECTPDFSCCNKDLLAEKETRIEFCEAFKSKDHNKVGKILSGFLACFLKKKGL